MLAQCILTAAMQLDLAEHQLLLFDHSMSSPLTKELLDLHHSEFAGCQICIEHKICTPSFWQNGHQRLKGTAENTSVWASGNEHF